MVQSTRFFAAAGACLIFALVVCRTASASELKNAELGFSITIPDDFQEAPAFRTTDTLYAYSRGHAGEPGFGAIIVARLHSQLKHEKGDIAKVQQRLPQATGFTVKWDGIDLEGMQSPQSQAGVELSIQAVLIPLRGEAIGISLIGTPGNEAANLQVLQSVVTSVKGQSSWNDAGDKAVAGLTYHVLGVVALAVIIIAVTRKKRKEVVAASQATPPMIKE